MAVRREVDDALSDFLTLNRPDADYVAWRDDWRRIRKLADDLGAALFRQKQIGFDVQENIRALAPLRMRAPAVAKGYAVLARAVKGGVNPAREWLLWRLLQIWTQDFGGKLGVSVPKGGGQPRGPLVQFLQETAEIVLEDEMPVPAAIRTIVRREAERQARAHRG
jgi:hypothetical protein